MKSIKDKCYLASGYLAGLCIVIIMVIILAQVVGRMLGFIVPSAEDFSGYALAASTFFGLAYTFRTGGHIRVTLVIQHWSERARIIQELTILVFALLITCFMTYYCWHMVWESYEFEEVTFGYIPIPLWIPQVPVALGVTALNLAVLDELITAMRGGIPSYRPHEDEFNEDKS